MKLSSAAQALVFSQSMEKSFLRLKRSKAVRQAYVEAELVTGLAHQIRVLRQQRNWTQSNLAKRLKTTQGVVSRMEDPSYGKFSLKSLVQLSSAFDVAFYARFLPFSEFMYQTWDTSTERLQVLPYKNDAERVSFFSESNRITYIDKIESDSTAVGFKSIVNLLDQPNVVFQGIRINVSDQSATTSGFVRLSGPKTEPIYAQPTRETD